MTLSALQRIQIRLSLQTEPLKMKEVSQKKAKKRTRRMERLTMKSQRYVAPTLLQDFVQWKYIPTAAVSYTLYNTNEDLLMFDLDSKRCRPLSQYVQHLYFELTRPSLALRIKLHSRLAVRTFVPCRTMRAPQPSRCPPMITFSCSLDLPPQRELSLASAGVASMLKNWQLLTAFSVYRR